MLNNREKRAIIKAIENKLKKRRITYREIYDGATQARSLLAIKEGDSFAIPLMDNINQINSSIF